VLLHPSEELHRLANLPPSARVITEAHLADLRTDVLRFADELAADEAWGDRDAVAEGLHRNKLTASQIIAAHSSKLTHTAAPR
jgi:hypothetical protein